MFSSQRQPNGRRRGQPVRRRSKVAPWMLWALAILLTAVVLLGVYLLFLRPYRAEQNMTKLPIGQSDHWTTASDTLYYTRGSQLYSSNYRCQEKWSRSTATENMSLAASEKQVAAYSETQVQCFDNSGNLKYSKEFLGSIQSVRCGDSYLAVHVKEASGLYRLIVLDSSGNDHNIDLGNRYVVDFGYFTGDNLYIHSLDGVSVTPSAQIETYDVALASTGKISIQGQLLQNTVFFTDHLYAVGTNYLYDIGYVGDERSSKLIYGWNYAGYAQGKSGEPMFAFVPGGAFSGAESITTVRLCSFTGSDTFIQMKANTGFAFMEGGKLFTIAEDTLYQYDLTGNLKGSYKLPFAPTAISPVCADGSIALYGESGIWLLKLP